MTDEMRKRRVEDMLDAFIGAVLCGIAAVGASVIAIGHSWEVSVPLAFVAILLLIAAVFGARAGVLGTIIAALIFAAFLFHPQGSLQVGADAARNNLAWMLLLGISFAFLFAPRHSSFRGD